MTRTLGTPAIDFSSVPMCSSQVTYSSTCRCHLILTKVVCTIISKGAVKFDVVLNNWPWMLFETSNSSYNDTYLAYFFDTDTELDTDGLIHVWDADRETHVLAQSKLATIKMDFLVRLKQNGLPLASYPTLPRCFQ